MSESDSVEMRDDDILPDDAAYGALRAGIQQIDGPSSKGDLAAEVIAALKSGRDFGPWRFQLCRRAGWAAVPFVIGFAAVSLLLACIQVGPIATRRDAYLPQIAVSGLAGDAHLLTTPLAPVQLTPAQQAEAKHLIAQPVPVLLPDERSQKVEILQDELAVPTTGRIRRMQDGVRVKQ